MNCKIPFTKDIDFEKKLHEITSISLEHELSTTEDTLKGNFIISGDYKSHEVSVNKEPFSYVLPFEIALTPEVDKDTIEFMIEDFTYEIIEESKLRVKIDFNVIASTKEIEEEVEPEIFREAPEAIIKEEVPDILEIEETKEEKKEIVEESKKVEDRDDKISEDTIIDNVNALDNNYATYHIHVVSDGESIETICTMYNSSMNILSDYNDLSNLTSGDKLIIPESNE
ncbi:MAG: LysM peptidoglycan-binding domain-containing protein [Ruminococcus sp.]|nr:LysM peptidoglycan-binding domain-containing protein [Ruminococcus sp.]